MTEERKLILSWRRISMIFARLLIAIVCVVIPITGFAQSQVSTVERRSVTIQVDRVALGVVFSQLMFDYGVVIAFEESELDRAHLDYVIDVNVPPGWAGSTIPLSNGMSIQSRSRRVYPAKSHLITLHLVDRPLSEALDKIVAQMSYYRWEVSNGVVIIMPSEGRDDDLRQFLELKISRYSLPRQTAISTIKYSIGDLPEVKEFLEKHELQYFMNQVMFGHPKTPNIENINFEDIRLIDLLNEISKVKGGGWALTTETTKQTRKKFLNLDI